MEQRKRAEYKSSLTSKRQLKKAFAALLSERPLNKITVTAVIERAGVSRSTFYAHYDDIQDLLSAIEKEESERLLQYIRDSVKSYATMDPKPLLTKIADYIAADKEYYRLLFLSDKSGSLLDTIRAMITDRMLTDPVLRKYSTSDETTLRIYIDFFLSGSISVIMDWFMGDLPAEGSEILDIISSITTSSLNNSGNLYNA